MKPKSLGTVKTYRVRQKRPNGDIYIIERKVIYDVEKKHNQILSTRLVGKIVRGTDKMVPTRPKRSSARKGQNDPDNADESEDSSEA